MDRRGYLSLVGASMTVGLAGCGGTDEEVDGTTLEPGGTQPEDGAATGDETTAPGAGEDGTTPEPTEPETTTAETTEAGTEGATTETTAEGTTTGETADAPGDVSTVVIEGSILADGGVSPGLGKRVEVTVTNQGDAASGEVTVTVRWYDESGTLVATSNETVSALDPRETAIAEIPVEDEGVAEAVTHYDIALGGADR